MTASILKMVDLFLRHVIGQDGHLDQSRAEEVGQQTTVVMNDLTADL